MPRSQAVLHSVSPSPVVSDNFNRGNDASNMGSAQTGQAWSVISGTWGILGNTGYKSATDLLDEIVVIESGVARCTITIAKCTFAIASRNAGLVWRHNGLTGLSANWYQAKWNGTTNTFTIERWDSGILGATLVSVGAISAPVDNVFILIVGNTYSVYQDGVFLATVTDATYPTNTKHGFMSGLSNGPLIDNYKVTPLE